MIGRTITGKEAELGINIKADLSRCNENLILGKRISNNEYHKNR